jgi:CRP/FNR family transcriptional regulator, cyclic AMP receptor protein
MIRSLGLSHSVSEKMARLLLECAPTAKRSRMDSRSRSPSPHEEIAQLVGTSRETLTRVLSEFREKKMAQLDRPGLETLVGA